MADRPSSAVSCDQLTLPSRLDSPRSKLLYLTIAVTGSIRASELRSTLGMSPLSFYPIIRNLREKGLVERAEDGAFRVVNVESRPVGG